MADPRGPIVAALPWYTTFLCAGVGACVAEFVTLPVDTAKVRLQLLKKAGATGPSQGMIGIGMEIAKREGVLALYKGFWPAMHRQLVFASLRVGLYGQISALFKRDGQATLPLTSKIAAGLVSGAIGITVATPTDLVKVRFQAESLPLPGQMPRYSGVMNAYATIVRQEGLAGLWTGLGPNIVRNSVINATELVSYESAKEMLLHRFEFADGLPVHFTAGAFAGLMATVLGAPVDVVKTRVMASARASVAGVAAEASQTVYTGTIDCVIKTLRNEGPLAFYKGCIPLFVRITGW
jgi:solute carrier family 25 (mitochondrial uncoupling protein), member 8/9